MTQARRLVLASGSPARRRMLADAGLDFEVVPAVIDEDGLRDRMLAEAADAPHAEIARALAVAKARDVSSRRPGARVIGSDQILSTGSGMLSKPATLDDARATLKALRGRTHWLHSAVALVEDGETIWSAVDTASLTMHAVSDSCLERYLDAAGDAILGCVGAYQIEGTGVRLFDAVEGNHWTILGMPLLPLLSELRRLKEIDV